MTEDDNIVLRLLREIRGKLEEHDARFAGIEGRMTTLERKMDDVNESVGYALGLSAHANVAYETSAQRLDRLTDEVRALAAKVAELEAKE